MKELKDYLESINHFIGLIIIHYFKFHMSAIIDSILQRVIA